MRTMTISILAVLVFLLATCAGCMSAKSIKQVRDHRTVLKVSLQQAAAVELTVVCMEGETRISGGSGVIINQWAVITAAHVVRCKKASIMATTIDGKHVIMTVEAFDDKVDIARLVATHGNFDFEGRIEIAQASYDQEVCMAAGMPGRVYLCGKVGGYRFSRSGDMILDKVHVIPGNSGSGVYDRRGRLVGIVTHYTPSNGGGLATSMVGKEYFLK